MSRDVNSNQNGSLGMAMNNRIETNTTVSRNAVPQRGCAVENRRTEAMSKGAPAS